MNRIIDRTLKLELPPGQSAFLWGPRKTGKSTYLKQLFPKSTRYDLLETDLFLRLAKEPSLLRSQLLASKTAGQLILPVIVDEVQKIPILLDEIHGLIENHGLDFVLCGSSARKLKRGQANLLGGRAWRFELFPLTWKELGELDLLQALNRGLLPPHYFSERADRSLRAYIQDYLKEEIQAEGLVRKLPPFARFLDAIGYTHGELTNYANIARDCAVDAKTVRAYYEILCDTLMGRFVEPFVTHKSRQTITSTAKFYFCDVGVAGILTRRQIPEAKGNAFGRAFEHLVLMELWAHRRYTELDYDIRFWRTNTGLEVDFVLGDGDVAVKVKGSSRIDPSDLTGLKAFSQEHPCRDSFLVCNEPRARQIGAIQILPWQEFFRRLWAGEIVR